ncbi:hypothetical protein ACFYTQ_34615, partial [Nocardia sp. NPDC004068]|uniref:hypothetical protein n=1 Tax=Nocardia sp. NPDC004068 TaxID=3364303 RepID=UPI00369C55DC
NSFGYGFGTATSSQARHPASQLGCHLSVQQPQVVSEVLTAETDRLVEEYFTMQDHLAEQRRIDMRIGI